MEINRLIIKYLNHKKINNCSSQQLIYIKHYLNMFAGFIGEYYKITHIEDVTSSVIKEFQEDISYRISRYGTLWKIKSQNRATGIIKVFFKWLTKEDYLASDPSINIEYAKEPEELPKNILDEPEIIKLLNQPDTTTITGYRDRVILEILYSTGIRKSELENLKLSDVDYNEGYILVDQGKNRKDRVVPIGRTASDMIRNYILFIRSEIPSGKHKSNDSGYLFINKRGNRIFIVTVWKNIKKYLKQAGIKKKITPHSLRHTCSTHMLRNGAHIRHLQEMLGHTCITTTEKYTRVTINELKSVHAKYHPREKSQV